MKKRTSLVCFLIFTLCVFYTAIPNTVFGQEEASLAEQVIEKHGETLMRPEIQGGFLLVLDVLKKSPDTAALLNAQTIELVISGAIPLENLIDRDTLTDEQVAALDQFLPLLEAKDEGVLALLRDPQVLEALKSPAAIEELEMSLTPPPDDTGTPPPDDTGTPPPDDTGTPPPDDTGTPPPDDTGTPPPDDTGTPPPDDTGTPPPDKVEPPPPIKQADPFAPITPTSLSGKSRLGGLSLNPISGRGFLQDLLRTATGLSIQELAALSGQTQDELVETIVQLIPKEVPFTKNQIRAFLKSDAIPIFSGQIDGSLAQGLDTENFGNAIMPMPLDLIYDDGMGDRTDPNRKYLTRNSLNLYVRVPSANVGGVTFQSSDGTLQKDGKRVGDPTALDGNFIDHTFRLEEALAATNLPAWPALEDELEQLFESVTLVYSPTLLDDTDDTGYLMQPTFGPNGVVWETTIEVTPGNSFYYYRVELAHPLTLKTLDREKLAAMVKQASGGGSVPTISDILNATKTYTINEWSMPDPRNLQLADRGILDALFNNDFRTALTSAVAPLLANIGSGTLPTAQEFLNALGKDRYKLQNILLGNAEKVTMRFEQAFDPMLSSVFSIPKPQANLESQSLWVASFDDIPDGHYFVGAVVHDEDGNALDQMWSDVRVDTKAPEADVMISKGSENTAVYENDDGVYVATTLDSGPATLKVTGKPRMGTSNYVGEGYGYLFYQIVGLNPDGTPLIKLNPNPGTDGPKYLVGDSSLQRPNTWMPLTPEATMLASTVWEQTIAQLVGQGALPEKLDLSSAGLGVIPTENLTLDLVNSVLPVLATPVGLGFIENDPTIGGALKGLGDFLGQDLLDPKSINLLVEVFGATVDIINHVPITYGDPNNDVMMLAQIGEDVLAGDYGIRALGIDTLFNVSSHIAPTRLRIVNSGELVNGTLVHFDRASVTFAVIGDCNMDGDMDDLFESGPVGDVTIFNNTTENVMLTVTVDHRSPHPATVRVQYMDAAGAWQTIPGSELDLVGYETGDTLTIPWDVVDFDELLGGNEMGEVMVRAVATNKLRLTDPDPTVGTINLDAGICPLDPEVIAIRVDPDSITNTNSESGAPQGTIKIDAYTPSRTSTDINAVRLAAKGPQDAEWTIENSETVGSVGGQELANLLGDLVSTVGPEKPVVNVNSTYQKWTVSIDTTTLMDTITRASSDDNQYVVTGYANTEGGEIAPIPGVEEKFSVDNIGPTKITAVATADGAVEAGEDGSYAVGGLVDKYDETVESPMVTFTIMPVSYSATYTSVTVVTDAEGVSIGEAEAAEDSGTFNVTVNVGILADGEYLKNGTYMFHAVAVDADGAEVSETDGAKISVAVENTTRPEPEVLALAVDPESITQTNPDSGAPQGTITIHAYSHEISSPATKAVHLVAKRPGDEEWKKIGEGTESTPTTEIPDKALSDLVGYLANAAATDTADVPINRTYQMWAIEVDTTELDDTITAENIDAARDASQDDNQYMVRAIPIEEAEDFADPEASPNATAMFSVDNDDDVAPEGPTRITAIADDVGMFVEEDGSYTISNVVDDALLSPMATFTIEQDPDVDPITYEGGSVHLMEADGTEPFAKSDAGVLDTITIDVGMLENGTYMFHALTVDKEGNIQTDESPMITVHILNFRVEDATDIAVIAVDGTDVADAPTEPIPLRNSVTVSFMVENGSLAAGELSGSVYGQDMTGEPVPEEDPENTFMLTVEVGSLADGVHTPDAMVKKRERSVTFPLATVNVDNTGPMVMIESPNDGEAVESLPTVHATYHDAEGKGSGTDKDGQGVLPWATTELADGPTVRITRLQPETGNTDVEVDQDAIETDNGTLVYTRTEQLPGGAYQITVQVADVLGNVGTGTREFVINGTLPTVAIHSPTAGQTFDHGQPLISGEVSGAGAVQVTTFTINENEVEATPEVDGNRFSYTPEEGLGDGNHTVVVAVTDGDGNTAQTSVTFTVEMPKDTTPPVISAIAPTGVIKDSDSDALGAVVISAVVTDEQSPVTSVNYSINGSPELSVPRVNIVEGRITAPVDYEANGDGLYNVRLTATSEGGTTEIKWTFTLIVDNVKPTITSITPSGTIRGGLPVISASANDESGVAEITIVVRDIEAEAVSGSTRDDGVKIKVKNSEGEEEEETRLTRVDFKPEAPLKEGVYTIFVRATDPHGNSSTSKGTFTIDFDTAAPVITVSSPRQDTQILLKAGDKAPTISITYTDAESGVNVESIRFILNDQLLTLSDKQKSASQVMYQLPISATAIADIHDYSWVGEYSVQLEVSDNAHLESDGRKANTTVHTFSFSLGKADAPLLSVPPINVPNPFVDSTEIRFTLNRQSRVNIVIYDSTLRPVRVLLDGVAEEPGKKEIEWDGTSSGGEDLARGIYFCQITVTDNIEPEYAMLKLALTR